MAELVMLVVEDEPEVRAAIVRDLSPLAPTIRIEQADDVADARAAMSEADDAGEHVALIFADHRLPGGESGVDLLVELNAAPSTHRVRTVLITGQAGHQDTIRAINEAGLDWYFSKPWDPDELLAVAKEQLTTFVIEAGLDPLPYVRDLDGPRLLAAFGGRGRPE